AAVDAAVEEIEVSSFWPGFDTASRFRCQTSPTVIAPLKVIDDDACAEDASTRVSAAPDAGAVSVAVKVVALVRLIVTTAPDEVAVKPDGMFVRRPLATSVRFGVPVEAVVNVALSPAPRLIVQVWLVVTVPLSVKFFDRPTLAAFLARPTAKAVGE